MPDFQGLVSAIQASAFADGVARHRIEANTRHAAGNRIRLTRCVLMAERVVEATEAATNLDGRRHDPGLVADLEIALALALKGVDHATRSADTRPPMGESGYLGA
jgi:hypothetical protein